MSATSRSADRRHAVRLGLDMLEDRTAPAAGILDPTFGADGKLTTAIGSFDDRANSVAVQADGRFVVAGYSDNGSNRDFAVARYNANGSLDTTFDGDGKLTTDFGSDIEQAYSVAVQADGKIVVAGNSFNGSNNDFALARYNTNGSLDNTFDGDGKLTTAVGSNSDQAFSVAVQADGKIVVAGSTWNAGNYDYALVRYNVDGSLDTTFDGDGQLTTDFGLTGNDEAKSVALQADGKIVVAGFSYNGSNNDFALARYNADGSLDTTFDSDGKLTTAIGSNNDFAKSVAVRADGKIIVAGYASGSNSDFALVRYNADGSLDNTFDGDGKLTTGITSSHDVANSMAVQADGQLVLVGYSGFGSNEDFALARYNPDGSLDNLADGTGQVQTNLGSTLDQSFKSVLQPDGKLVVVGSRLNATAKSEFAIVRYEPDGSLDTTFGTNGLVTVSLTTGNDVAYTVALTPVGKIVVGGTANRDAPGNGVNIGLVRLNPNGSLDTSFDGDGIRTHQLGGREEVRDLAVQADGSIVVIGLTDLKAFVSRYTNTGVNDTTFNTTGFHTLPTSTILNSVALQADGKIVAAGSNTTGGSNAWVGRWLANGTLDTTFGTGGSVTVYLSATAPNGANSILVQPDGKLLIGGWALVSTTEFALARLTTTGLLDFGFGTNGKLTTAVGLSDQINRLALQPDGKIIAVGPSMNGSNSDFGIARYYPDGALDMTFDGDGKMRLDFNAANDTACGVNLQTDGKIIVTGFTTSSGGDSDFALVRISGSDNRAPITQSNVGFSLNEDSAISGTITSFYTDPDSDYLTTQLLYAPQGGTLTLSPYGAFSYTPHANFAGDDLFSYKVSDSSGAFAIGTVTLKLHPSNDPPVRTAGVLRDLIVPNFAPMMSLGLENLSYSPGAGEESSQTLTFRIPDTLYNTNWIMNYIGTIYLADGTTVVNTTTDYTLDQVRGMRYLPKPAVNGAGFEGHAPFTFVVRDGQGGELTEEFEVFAIRSISMALINGGYASQTTLVPGQNFASGSTITTKSATVQFPSIYSYSLAGDVPAGASVNPVTGLLSWTPNDANPLRTYNFTVEAQNLTYPSLRASEYYSLTLVQSALLGDSLHIAGTSTNDVITVNPDKDPTKLIVKLGRTTLGTYPLADIPDGVGAIFVYGLGGNDKITISPKILKPTILDGGSGNDSITGGGGDTRLFGGEGNDRLTAKGTGYNVFEGGNGNDTLNGGGAMFGGLGNDVLIVSVTGNHELHGNEGNDRITGGLGNETLSGGEGNDTLNGGAGNDAIFGEAGNDVLAGGTGKNFLSGGEGNDRLTGGADRDILVGGAGLDLLNGGAGDDILIGGTADIEGAYEEIASKWNSSSSYTTRVSRISDPTSGEPYEAYLTATTVYNDGVKDTLTGGSGLDWFVINPQDISDFNAATELRLSFT